MLLITGSVAFITLFEPRDRFGGRYDRLVGVSRIGGSSRLAPDKQTDHDEEGCKEYFCHNALSLMCVGVMGNYSQQTALKLRAQSARASQAVSVGESKRGLVFIRVMLALHFLVDKNKELCRSRMRPCQMP